MKDLPQGTTKSHLDEILKQFDDRFVYWVVMGSTLNDGSQRRWKKVGQQPEEVRNFIRTSLISLLEKCGEKVIAVALEYGDTGVSPKSIASFQLTKLKEILSSLK